MASTPPGRPPIDAGGHAPEVPGEAHRAVRHRPFTPERAAARDDPSVEDKGAQEDTRVDKWLWSVRIFKTRSLATDACRAGHVSVNHAVTKPATTVRVGDTVVVRMHGVDRVLEVARVISSRVGAPTAAECLIDHTPPPPPAEDTAPGLVRDARSGRPTKRDRRQIDRLRRT